MLCSLSSISSAAVCLTLSLNPVRAPFQPCDIQRGLVQLFNFVSSNKGLHYSFKHCPLPPKKSVFPKPRPLLLDKLPACRLSLAPVGLEAQDGLHQVSVGDSSHWAAGSRWLCASCCKTSGPRGSWSEIVSWSVSLLSPIFKTLVPSPHPHPLQLLSGFIYFLKPLLWLTLQLYSDTETDLRIKLLICSLQGREQILSIAANLLRPCDCF